MRVKLIALAAFAVMALAGCGEPPPETGTVYKKHFRAAHTWYSTQCAMYNSKGSCVIWQNIPHHEPDNWQLCIRDGERKGCFDVPERVWDRYEVGEAYPELQ